MRKINHLHVWINPADHAFHDTGEGIAIAEVGR